MFYNKATTKLTSSTMIPFGAATTVAITSIVLGRSSTSKTTHHVSNVATKRVHTWMTKSYMSTSYYCNNSSINNNIMMMKFTKNMNLNTNSTMLLSKRNLSTTTTNSTTNSSSFLQWYEGHLQSKPIQTKMVTGSILWGLGDVVAQVVPVMFFDQNDSSTTTTSSSSNNDDNNDNNQNNNIQKMNHDNNNGFVYDYPRTARAMFYGFVIHAPLSHAHFNFLEWMTVKGGFTGLSIPLFKAFMEQVS